MRSSRPPKNDAGKPAEVSSEPGAHVARHAPPHSAPPGRKDVAMALGALGVVFGDIGTSPLYAMKECFFGLHPIAPTPANVLGVLSLVFWSLTMVVTFKYIGFILRADNRGEGGIFALLALLPAGKSRGSRMVVLGAVFGAALLYGDGVITPAISVLSAVEGLRVATTAAEPAILPLTVLILFALFILQHRGTAGIGSIFGPIMAGWFLVVALLGIGGIVQNPVVLQAVNPYYGVEFFAHRGFHGFLVLGAVVLCITGAEALYADLGHFGHKPIRLAWFVLAFPALLLNYAGQGALLLARPESIDHPFFDLVPQALLYPVVALATAATVIASQALISGAFSLTRQAILLGYLPRMHIVHTSGATRGQIYIPWVNWMLMVACIALVVAFQQSSQLAAAYGVAVTTNMAITSMLFFLVMLHTWSWSLWKAIPLVTTFLVFDLSFFGANILKVVDGGWVPLVVAFALLTVMFTWRDGRAALREEILSRLLPFELFLEEVQRREARRVPGTAVFLASNPVGTPTALLHHFKHNQILHEQVVLLSMLIREDVPVAEHAERVRLEELGDGFYRVQAHYGFMEMPNVRHALQEAGRQGLTTDPASTSFILGRETLLTSGRSKMMPWRKRLFRFLSQNATPATAYFGLPPGRVVELGMQVEL